MTATLNEKSYLNSQNVPMALYNISAKFENGSNKITNTTIIVSYMLSKKTYSRRVLSFDLLLRS